MSEAGSVPRGGFAKVFASFGTLSEIESRLSVALEKGKVPWDETRKLLQGGSAEGKANTPLFQFMSDLFEELGFGRLELVDAGPFSMVFAIEECPICQLFSDAKGQKVCYPTADAIKQFLLMDLGIGSRVEETACRNAGDDRCTFKAEMERFSVLNIALDEVDIHIVAELLDPEIPVGGLADAVGVDQEEIDYRLARLKEYGLITQDNTITEVGEAYCEYILSNPQTPWLMSPPWEDMEALTEAIATTRSFAESLVEVADGEKMPWETEDSEVIDVKERAMAKRGFAELMASMMGDDADRKDREGGEADKGDDA